MENGSYYHKVVELVKTIEVTQSEAICTAAVLIKKSLEQGGVLHAFSAGHSHMMVEELFYRAGGLVPVNPIFDPGTMLHQGAQRSTGFERLSGYAQVLLKDVDLRPGEPILIVSNSGINPLPVEMALLAKQKQLTVIAITSTSISQGLISRACSGERLMEVADTTLDNCIQESDAAVQVSADGLMAGALSTIAGAYLVQRLVLEIIQLYLQSGLRPPVFMSANIPGGDEWNAALINRYRSRIKNL